MQEASEQTLCTKHFKNSKKQNLDQFFQQESHS